MPQRAHAKSDARTRTKQWIFAGFAVVGGVLAILLASRIRNFGVGIGAVS